MHKAHLATIAVAVVTLPVIAVLISQNAKLKQQIETHRIPLGKGEERGSDPLRTGQTSQGTEEDPGKMEKTGASAPGELQSILAQPNPMDRIRALLAYVDGLSPEQFATALDEVRKGAPDSDPEARILLHMILSRWAEEDPDAAFANLDGLDFRMKRTESTNILASLAAQNPKRAAAWLEDPENGLVNFAWMGRILAGTIAKEWVKRDPDAALEWSKTLPADQQAGAYSGVLVSLAATDPKRASGLATTLEPGKTRSNVVGEISRTWARNDPVEALAWAKTLEGQEQSAAYRQAIGAWSQKSPEEAARYVDELAAGGAKTDSYVMPIVSNWSSRDPAEAATWLDEQSDGPGKNGAMGQVLWNWTNRDPAQAGEWLGTQPEGPARDAGIGGLVRAAFEFDPPGALAWAAQLSDEGNRERTVGRYVQTWVRRDAEAANHWAEENGVTIPAAPVYRGSKSSPTGAAQSLDFRKP